METERKMREIKFRVWDTEVKEFARPTDFYISPKGDVSFYWNAKAFHSTRAILMQFTGLKDKNGKEIFEGDIVKVTRSITGMRDEESISEIKYFDTHGCFGFTTKYGWLDFSNCQMDTLEVIGNIYSNPELLKIKV